jgi:uncharacterized protein involved in response to NO
MLPDTIRREPYRLLFPAGLLLAAAGVLPWLLFARGALSTWPGPAHTLVMSQGFFVAIACGFLGTMLPRRTGTAALSGPAVLGLAAAPLLLCLAIFAGSVAVAQVIYVAIFAGLGLAAARRARRAAPPPASFVLVLGGALLAVTGAVLLFLEPTSGLGRTLVSQGLMLCLVLATAPILLPALLGTPPTSATRLPYVLAFGTLAASFAIELWLSVTAGLLLRAATCAAVLVHAGVLLPATRPGVHRALFRLALLLVPLGLCAAGLMPEKRVAFLHITHVGGFALLILAVSVHVTLLHGDRADLASGRPVRVIAAGLCLLGAVALRAMLENFGDRYLEIMVAATALWLAAVLLWGSFLLPHLRRSPS